MKEAFWIVSIKMNPTKQHIYVLTLIVAKGLS